MSQTVSDYLLERLKAWDVDTVFAYPGDGINGLLAAWQRMEEPLKFVQARHEEMAAFEAVGYAKYSGKVGVCMATSGPGAIHLLNGLYDAKLDHVPVVAIVGQTNRSAMGGHYQQEVDLLSLFKDVAGDFVQMLTVPEQLPNLVDRAIRTAIGRSTVTAIIVPYDVQELEYIRADPRLQDGHLLPRRGVADRRTRRRGPATGRRPAQRRGEGRDAGRPGRPQRAGRGRAGGRDPRRRSGQSAAGQGRAVR